MPDLFHKSVRIASRVLIVGTALFSLWVAGAFVWAFLEGALMDNRLDEVAESIISLHADLLTSAILLMIVMLFRRTLNSVWLAATLLAAFVFGSYDFQDFVIHPILVDIGVYDFMMREGQTETTPQVTRAFVLLFSMFALFGLCSLARTRTRDRVFVLLIGGVVVTTTLIFHFALPMGMLRYEKDRVAVMMLAEARLFPVEDFCSDRTCLFLGDGFVEAIGKRHAPHPLPPREFVEHSAEAVMTAGHSTKYVRSTSFNGTTFAIDGCVPRKDYRPPETRYLCFSDARMLDGLGRTTAAWMGFLSSAAHGTWLFGGVLLLWLHRRRFKLSRKPPVVHRPPTRRDVP